MPQGHGQQGQKVLYQHYAADGLGIHNVLPFGKAELFLKRYKLELSLTQQPVYNQEPQPPF